MDGGGGGGGDGNDNDGNTIIEWYYTLPLITRSYLTGITVVALLCVLCELDNVQLRCIAIGLYWTFTTVF
jgi:hypothetical protein